MLALNFYPFPALQTERLSLREISSEDAGEIFFLRSDKRVMKYIDRDPAQSIEDALNWIRIIVDLLQKAEAVTWAICLKTENKMIGTITLWNIQKDHHRAEVGYALHPDWQGRGIMQEALKEVLNFGFRKMKLHSVEANVNPQNKASIKLLERNRFIREAYFRENYYYNGEFLDSAIYSLLTPYR
jgi:ribosomal-protein-alanine N-acetyltransferase